LLFLKLLLFCTNWACSSCPKVNKTQYNRNSLDKIIAHKIISPLALQHFKGIFSSDFPLVALCPKVFNRNTLSIGPQILNKQCPPLKSKIAAVKRA
jgi:hypothetical protein